MGDITGDLNEHGAWAVYNNGGTTGDIDGSLICGATGQFPIFGPFRLVAIQAGNIDVPPAERQSVDAEQRLPCAPRCAAASSMTGERRPAKWLRAEHRAGQHRDRRQKGRHQDF